MSHPAAKPEPAPQVVRLSDKTAPRSARTKEVAGISLAAIGIAVAIGGVVCGVLAKQAGDNLTKLDQNGQKFDYSQQQAGLTEQTLEGVLLGVGGAAVVTGTVLYFLGRHERNRARIVSVAPSVGPGVMGASISGSF